MPDKNCRKLLKQTRLDILHSVKVILGTNIKAPRSIYILLRKLDCLCSRRLLF